VYAVDRHDFSGAVQQIRSALRLETLTFLHGDLRTVLAKWTDGPVAMAFSQRTLHYLEPKDATELAKQLFSIMAPGGSIFVSASGLGSELGQNYSGRDVQWSERYHPLSDAMQQRHGIEGRVCLYTEEDMTHLFENAGFERKSIYSSTFGNVKAIFCKAG
jgi:hypothetical protein